MYYAWAIVLLVIVMTSPEKAEVFTSSEKMSDLAALEEIVIKSLRSRIQADTMVLERRWKEIERLKHGRDVWDHPNGAYLLVKTFIYSWGDIINTYPEFRKLSDSHVSLLPTLEDLQGTQSAILRLQRVYGLPVAEMYAGNYTGYLGPSLEPLDAYVIGRQGFTDGLLNQAISWLELAVQKSGWSTSEDPDEVTEKMALDKVPDEMAERMTSDEDPDGLTERMTSDEELDEVTERMTSEKVPDVWTASQMAAVLGLLGRVYLYAGNPETASIIYKEAIVLDASHGDVVTLGEELLLRGGPPPAFPREKWHENMSELCSREKQHTVVGEYIQSNTADLGPHSEVRPYHICRYKTSFLALYVKYKEEIISLAPYVSLFHDVISDSEIEAVKGFAKGKMQRAGVQNKAAGKSLTFARTSDNCWIKDVDMQVTGRLSFRVMDITGLDTRQRIPDGTSSAESLQVVNYGLGGHYNAHYDPVKQPPPQKDLKHAGERIATFLFYLSDVEKGGHTVFVKSGISIAPKKGMALFWYNYNPAMDLDMQTQHAGCPVLKGNKWIANKWIWTYGNTFRRPCGPSPQSTQLDLEVDGRLLVLCFLVCGIVAPSQGRHTVSYAVTDGDSGVKCTNKGRHCVLGMRCAGRKCQCPKGYKGDAEFECVKTKEKLCSVTGEGTVSMKGYGGSDSVVNLPCSYLASRFVVRQSGGQSFCGVEVHVTNELQRDNFVARTVHVSVGMTEPARLVQYYTDVMVTGSYDESKSYNYVIRASPLEAFTWGSSTMTDKHQGDILNATVDKEDNFVVLDLPTCETRVKFRAYDSTRNAQGQLPGVSIAAPEHAEFVHEVGDYPYSLCGRSKDPKQLYRNRAKDLRLNGPSDAIIWDILSQQPHQFDNPEAEQCERAMELFAASSDQRAHFKACSFVLSKKRLRGCLKKNGLSPIEVFNSCLSYLQLPTDAHACQELKSASGSCRNLWNGPKTYSCQ